MAKLKSKIKRKLIKIVTSVIPVKSWRHKARNFLKNGFPSNFCPLCSNSSNFLDSMNREKSQCPHCYSLERHRFFYFIYKALFLNSQHKVSILHIAPEKSTFDMIQKNSNLDYTAADLFPEGFPHVKALKENACEFSFKDNTFDFYIANHVFEHLMEEEKALKECLRVLKPGGKALLSVPIFDAEETFQDDSITSAEDRIKYYGQDDHVRAYGRDIIKRWQKFCPEFKISMITDKEFFISEEVMRIYSPSNNSIIILEK